MKELKFYEKYLYSILEAIQKPAVIFPGITLSITINAYHWMIFLLFGLLAVDYATGVLASWVQWKKDKKEGKFRKEGFTSEKSRLSLVKAVTYFLFILLSYIIESVFKIKPWQLSWTDHQVTITSVSMAISCAIEFYSIFFENLPKAGFSIWDKFKSITGKAKEAVSEIKDITNGNGNNLT